jgi:integration host factor subunit alpha
MAFTKPDIIKAVAEQNGFSIRKSAETVETTIEIIKKALESGEDVMISRFGKFCVKEKKEWKGRNLVTGEELMQPPRRVVRFKCSRKLRVKING